MSLTQAQIDILYTWLLFKMLMRLKFQIELTPEISDMLGSIAIRKDILALELE